MLGKKSGVNNQLPQPSLHKEQYREISEKEEKQGLPIVAMQTAREVHRFTLQIKTLLSPLKKEPNQWSA